MADPPGPRRSHRPPLRPPHPRPRLLPRPRAVQPQARREVLRLEVGRPDDPGPGPLERPGVGLALPDLPVLARGGRPASDAQDLHRPRPADCAPGPPLAPRAGV